MIDDTIIDVDLFCGAGGFSEALSQACNELEVDVCWVAINHWDAAVKTHQQNHPEALQYNSKVETLHPPNVLKELIAKKLDIDPDDVDLEDVDILVVGPECTHFSNARGGKPVSEQKRMSPWHIVDWLEKLNVDVFIIENVKEIQQWGPIDDGEPSRDGSIFDAWLNALNSLGYSVDWDVLNAADYGDPTSRRRFFLIGSQTGSASFPEPTHSNNADDDLEDWRTAAEIIDWSDLGTSIWSRDIENPRVTPPSENTMLRIAEGIRRHCDDALEPFADAIDQIAGVDLEELREERVVPCDLAQMAAEVTDDPFLVDLEDQQFTLHTPWVPKYYGTSTATPIDAPIDTITSDGNHHALSVPGTCRLYATFREPQSSGATPDRLDTSPLRTITTTSRGVGITTPSKYVIGQHSNSVPRAISQRPCPTVAGRGNIHCCTAATCVLRQQDGAHPIDVTGRPIPTIATGGAHQLMNVECGSLVMPRNGPRRDIYSNPLYDPRSRPLHTVTAKNTDGHLLTPQLHSFSHSGRVRTTSDMIPTLKTEKGGTWQLVQPYMTPLYNGRSDQRPRTRCVDRPMPVVPENKGSPATLATPFLRDYHGNSWTAPVDEPIGAQETKHRYALCVPELLPYGLDIKYRMLKPSELKQAQGFPEDYEIVGTKTDTTKQIGNAVPVHLAKALCKHLLSSAEPSLSSYGGGLQEGSVTIEGDTPAEVAENVSAGGPADD